MNLAWVEEFEGLSPGERELFEVSIRKLLSEGLVYRGTEGDVSVYGFLRRHLELVREYLKIGGWELRFWDRQEVYQVLHLQGAHRERLDASTTKWLLLVRLLYAEAKEGRGLELTLHPTVSLEDAGQRYAQYFKNERFQTKMKEALVRFVDWKLIRWHKLDAVLELLPTLEVIAPASGIEEAAKRLVEHAKVIETPEEVTD